MRKAHLPKRIPWQHPTFNLPLPNISPSQYHHHTTYQHLLLCHHQPVQHLKFNLPTPCAQPQPHHEHLAYQQLPPRLPTQHTHLRHLPCLWQPPYRHPQVNNQPKAILRSTTFVAPARPMRVSGTLWQVPFGRGRVEWTCKKKMFGYRTPRLGPSGAVRPKKAPVMRAPL